MGEGSGGSRRRRRRRRPSPAAEEGGGEGRGGEVREDALAGGGDCCCESGWQWQGSGWANPNPNRRDATRAGLDARRRRMRRIGRLGFRLPRLLIGGNDWLLSQPPGSWTFPVCGVLLN